MSKTGSLFFSKSASLQRLRLFQSSTDLACALPIFSWGSSGALGSHRCSAGKTELKEENVGDFEGFFEGRKAPAHLQLGSWELCQAGKDLG